MAPSRRSFDSWEAKPRPFLFWAITSSLSTFRATYIIIQSCTFPCKLLNIFTWHHHSYFTPLLFKRSNYYQLPGCQNLMSRSWVFLILITYNTTSLSKFITLRKKNPFPLTVHGRGFLPIVAGHHHHSYIILDSSWKPSDWTSIPRSLIHHFPHTITHCGRHKIPHSHSNHDYKLLTTASSLLARLDSRSRKDARNFRFSWSQGLKTTDRGVSSGPDITYQPTTYSLLYIPWWVSIHVTHTRRLLPMPGYRRVGGLLYW